MTWAGVVRAARALLFVVVTNSVMGPEGLRFRVPFRSDARALGAETYELLELALIRTSIFSDDVVVEIGAGFGITTSVLTTITHGKVLACEPNRINRLVAVWNLRRNGLKCVMLSCGLGYDTRARTQGYGLGAKLHVRGKSGMWWPFGVRVVTLRSLLENASMRGWRVTAVVVDAEGAEHQLFSEEGAFIRRSGMKIVAEVHCSECCSKTERDTLQYFKLLREDGWQVRGVASESMSGGWTRQQLLESGLDIEITAPLYATYRDTRYVLAVGAVPPLMPSSQ